ncbi:protein hinderin isoform X2 [Gouania willdenowi]|uniref:protein hinderin isoform X2 n=1 Tax=Gouania willdenowi TaxID=441366 RepID=UPI0010566347|nr:protein hinderin isoform X2 [Gouania willdenowi]
MAAAAEGSGHSGIVWMKNGVDRGGKIQTPFISGRACSSSSNRRDTKKPIKPVCRSRNLSKPTTIGEDHASLHSDRSEVFTQKESAPLDNDGMILQPRNAFVPLSQFFWCRVSEEKEEFFQRLKDEQGNFERQMKQLEQQNLVIAHERESLRQQYRECQELLGLYQQYLSQQQAQLNQSIAQLSHPGTHSMDLCSEEAPSRAVAGQANGSLFDGSYLSLPACGGQQTLVHKNGDGQREAVQTDRNPSVSSCVFEPSPFDGVIKQHKCEKKVCRECHRCEQIQDGVENTKVHMCYGGQQRKSEILSLPLNDQEECKRRGNTRRSEAKEALACPMLGQVDWEEKKHHLLLQKTQLEMERERLQARLAEQEERISRQNEQLQQSRLHHSSAPFETEIKSSKTRIEASEQDTPSQEDLHSSRYGEAAVHVAGHGKCENYTQTGPATPNDTNVYPKLSKRDFATSQAKPSDSQSKPTSLSVPQKTSEPSVNYSMVELLDIISPVSAANRRPQTSQLKPALAAPTSVSRGLLTPGGRFPPSTQQDLEESQILEDIFFIC